LRRGPVGEAFGQRDGFAAPLVGEQIPDAAAAGQGEQAELAVTRLSPQELQHRLGVGAFEPLCFHHGWLSPRYFFGGSGLGTSTSTRPPRNSSSKLSTSPVAVS